MIPLRRIFRGIFEVGIIHILKYELWFKQPQSEWIIHVVGNWLLLLTIIKYSAINYQVFQECKRFQFLFHSHSLL